MYIYNVTINIEETVHDKWLHWMKEEHIPAMLATGKFHKALMTRVQVEALPTLFNIAPIAKRHLKNIIKKTPKPFVHKANPLKENLSLLEPSWK